MHMPDEYTTAPISASTQHLVKLTECTDSLQKALDQTRSLQSHARLTF